MNRWFRAWLITACFVLVFLILLGPIQQISVVTGQGGDPRKPKPTPTPAKKSSRPPPVRARPKNLPTSPRDSSVVATPSPTPTPTPTPIPTPSPTPTPTPMPRTRTGQAGIEFVLIPAGELMMGSTNGEEREKPVHRVAISQPFYMGKYEVTQAQWQAVMGNNPSHFKNCDNCPVEQVSWDDTQYFLTKLNDRNDGSHYRLPSEAEWEYACRAGTTGDYAGDLDLMAWYRRNSDPFRTHPVGSKQSNAWGLYDMHGNVFEWCQDWLDEEYYRNSPSSDPQGSSSGQGRVLRGGSWYIDAGDLRSAYRGWTAPDKRSDFCGFRVVAVSRTQ
jgi:formylglycine-generating enzyme required for sulfatase activity